MTQDGKTEEKEAPLVYSDWLYIPKGLLYDPTIKAALTFVKKGYKSDTKINGWKEAGDFLLVPRDFYNREHLAKRNLEVVDEIPEFSDTNLQDNIELDKISGGTKQRESFDAMSRARNGVLNLGCGLGKTVIALKYVCAVGHPAIVIVETIDLLHQWMELIGEFIKTPFKVGVVQGNPSKWTWKRPITVAMIQSLARYEDSIPRGMREYFGLAIYDECHHLSSRFFVKAAPMFYGKRIGLTATPRREDGLENLYYGHIGKPFYRDIQQPLTPKVIFYGFDLPIDWDDRDVLQEICDVNGELSFPKLWGFVGKHPDFQSKSVGVLLRMLDQARKVLVLSHRVDTLVELHRRLEVLAPDSSGLVIGSVKTEKRRERLKTKRIVLGTMQLAKEGLDEKKLDTLFILEPFKAEGVLQQSAGRILRPYSGKKQPLICIMRLNHPVSYALTSRLRKHLKRWPTKVEQQTLTI